MKTIYILVLATLLFFLGCSKQDYYDIPVDESGNAVITPVTQVKSKGIKKGEVQFEVAVEFKNAKEGDVIYVELLKQQQIGDGSESQLLPLQGMKKEHKLTASMTLNVIFTTEEAQLVDVGDFVVVAFSSITDSASIRIEMEEKD